jgi:hypothetical protein
MYWIRTWRAPMRFGGSAVDFDTEDGEGSRAEASLLGAVGAGAGAGGGATGTEAEAAAVLSADAGGPAGAPPHAAATREQERTSGERVLRTSTVTSSAC